MTQLIVVGFAANHDQPSPVVSQAVIGLFYVKKPGRLTQIGKGCEL